MRLPGLRQAKNEKPKKNCKSKRESRFSARAS
jgi:hypothetical protein